MLTYEELKENRRKFVSFTSLTPNEFDLLLPAIERTYLRKYPASKTKAGGVRKRKAGTGRKGSLVSIEQKLLFALVYQKSYPLQSVMGELFGMGQSQANEWIHCLLPILKQALDNLGYEPERDPKKFKEKEQDRKATPWGKGPKYLIRDRDKKYATHFSAVAGSIKELKTPYRTPQANGTCERFMGSLRRECLDHVLIRDGKHLER